MIMRLPQQDKEFDDSHLREQNCNTEHAEVESGTDERCLHVWQVAPTLTETGIRFVNLAPSQAEAFRPPSISGSNAQSNPIVLSMTRNVGVRWTTPSHIVLRRSADCVEVLLGRSRRLILSRDQGLLCFDSSLGTCRFVLAENAANMLSPRVSLLPAFADAARTTIPGLDGQPCELSRELGWWIGCVIGNGWLSSKTRVYMSGAIGSSVLDAWAARTKQLFNLTCARPQDRTEAKNSWGAARKISVNNVRLARWMAPLIGHGAGKKHLPDFAFLAPPAFRLGLISGLMDTDGTLNVTKSGRFNVCYTTKSARLCREFAWMLTDLGVDSNYQLRIHNHGRRAWVVHPSVVDFHKLTLDLVDPARQHILSAMRQSPPSARYRNNDIVPLSHSEARCISAMFKGSGALKKTDYDTDLRTLYTASRHAINNGYIGRQVLSRIILWLGDRCPVTVRDRFNQDVHWEPVHEIVSVGSMDVLDIHFDDPALAIVGDYGIPVFASPMVDYPSQWLPPLNQIGYA